MIWSNNDGMDPNWKPYFPPKPKAIEFEFVFDPHDERFGMTEKQWDSLHGMKVRVEATPMPAEEVDSNG